MTRATATLLLLTMLALPAQAQEQSWHPTLKKGLAEAARSGQAILLVTSWKPGV